MSGKKYPVLPVIAFFVLTLCIFVPSTIYLTNCAEFTNRYTDLLLVGTGLSLVFGLAFSLILLLSKLLGPIFFEKCLSFFFGVGFLLWFQSNFLLWNYGPLDGRDINWSSMKLNGYIDGGIWMVVLAAALIFSPFVIKIAKKICLTLIVIQVGYGAILFLRQPDVPSFQKYTVNAKDKFVFSKNSNVIIVILDSFPSDVFSEIIQENPGLSAPLDGFTYFRNSLGGYPVTELSVALILTGKYYDNSLPFEQWKREAYLSNSIPHILKSEGWQVDIYPKVSYSVYYSEQIASNFVKNVPFTEKFFDVVNLYDLTLFRCLPHFLKPFVYNNQAWLLKQRFQDILGKRNKKRKIHTTRVTGLAPRKNRRQRLFFPKRAFRHSADVQFVNQMLSESIAAENKGTFKFYHLGVPHLPLLLDDVFNYKKMPVNRQNYKKYAIAGIKLMGMFLKHLQEIGVYDKSLIFIMGDHGAGGQRQDFIVQPGMPTEPKKHVVTERYRISAMPMILVKFPGSQGELKISDAPVSLGDVSATVFSSLAFPVPAPGLPMQNIHDSLKRYRRYLIYPNRDVFSYYGDMTEYFVSSYGWFDESWRRSGKVFTRKGVLVQPH